MDTNASASWRNRLSGFNPATGLPEDMPDWLRQQYLAQSSGSEGSSDGQQRYQGPGNVMLDSQGRSVALLNDNGGLADTSNLAFNQGAENSRRFDPYLGWVTDASNVNQAPYQASSGRLRNQAIGAFGALLGGAALQGAGLFGGSDGGLFGATGGLAPEEAAGGLGASGGAGSGAAGAGASWAEGGGFGAGGLAPEEMGAANYAAGAGATTPWYSQLGSTIGNAITNNPLSAARLGMTGASLVGGLLGGHQANQGGGGWNATGGLLGGLGGPQQAQSGFTPNAMMMAQLRQLYGG